MHGLDEGEGGVLTLDGPCMQQEGKLEERSSGGRREVEQVKQQQQEKQQQQQQERRRSGMQRAPSIPLIGRSLIMVCVAR
ncbi:hypothetical protein Pmani_038565 [Petrolisthes manimaculis]|uniref:Uncharacterized protein n=1 Tax=Petrolisthes manimaculis TaxID=1843537 RepID=A0AAE1TK97_9EUCA|nr:hypothetical protein Pmani_038565 [Petrolisthes manimaculis]